MPQTDPTSRAILRFGAPLSARYSVVRLLGVGPHAAVYDGLRVDGLPVTIKVFARELSRDPTVARELRDAIRRAGDVAHPGIVQPVDEGEADDGARFIVTPTLRGQTLRERADRAGGTLPVAELIAIADQALCVLAAAHDKGLVHGGVKPTNVLLTNDARVRLLDFGLGLGAARLPELDSRRAFLPPERRTATPPRVDARADVWGLGATLLFALTGRAASEAEGANGAAATLATLALPSEIAGVLSRSLAGDPTSRWTDAAAMREAWVSECAAAFGTERPLLRALAASEVDAGRASGAPNRGDADGTRFEAFETEQPDPPSRRESAGAPSDARIGSVLADKYRIEELLGEGGTAAVYRAAHRNGHRVAVKILHPRIAVEPCVRDRFLREGYVVNKIDHPGVVRVSDDCVLPDGTAFLVMELLSGESLDDHLARRGGVLSSAEVVRLSLQLLDVLSAAHAAGVVHRDVKPGNLFVTSEGTLRVLDFGIARVLDPEPLSRTRTGAVMGTPAFMAPEQALGQTSEVDARTDVWAVGATMVRLLTGEYVHAAPTAEAMRVYAGSRPARSLRTIAPRIDANLGAIVDKALASDKAARWPSAAAMREALASLRLSAAPAAAAPRARPGRIAKRRRQPLWALPLVSFFFSACALLTVPWRPTKATAQPTEPQPPAPRPTASAMIPPALQGSDKTEVPDAMAIESSPHDLQTLSAAKPVAHPAGSSDRTRRLAAAAPSADALDPCAPPYVTDAVGRRTYKSQCLHDDRFTSAATPLYHLCDPPYAVDAMGRRLYKPECLNQ